MKVLQAGSGRIYGRPIRPLDGVPRGTWGRDVDLGVEKYPKRLYLGVVGVRRALPYHGFRCGRDEQECKRYVEPNSHDAIDNESSDSRKEVFILPEHFWSKADPMPSRTVCGKSPAIEISSEENI